MKTTFRVLAVLALLAGVHAFAQSATQTKIVGTVRDLTGAIVTSGQISYESNAPAGTAIPGTGAFVSTVVSCHINSSGAPVSAADDGSPCLITSNSALTPTGTSYKQCIRPYNVSPGSCINMFATGGTIDISTIVPTPTTGPFNFSGTPGPPGPANTLAIGTVTTIPAGGSATATITGTPPSQILNMGLVTGDTGPPGPIGPIGSTGDTGATGPPGGSLSYPGVTTDGANGLAGAGSIAAGGTPCPSGAPVGSLCGKAGALAPTTIAGLGTASSANRGVTRLVTDAATNNDCSFGGGSSLSQCTSDGTHWLALGGPGVTFGTTAGTAAQGNDSRFQALSSGVLGYATQAALFADLAHPAGTIGQVTNDPTLALNGSYTKQGASGSGSWLQAVDRTTALGIRVGQIEVGNVFIPSPNVDTDLNPMYRYAVANYAVRRSFVVTEKCAPFSGYATQFQVNLINAEAGRTVNFYIATVSGTTITVTYDSGTLPAANAGIFTYPVPNMFSALVTAGQCVGAYVNPVSTSNSIGLAAPGGNVSSTLYTSTPLVLGTPTTGTAEAATRWLPITMTVTDHDMYVAKHWANQIGGYLAPDANTGTLPQNMLPGYLVNTNIPQTATNSTQANLWDANLVPYANQQTVNKVRLAPTTVTSVQDFTPTWSPANAGAPVVACGAIADGSNSATGYPQGKLIIDWNTQQGFAVGGILNRVRFYPATGAFAGAYVNVWVVRPSALPPIPAASAPYSFKVLAQAGTIDGSQANVYQELTGLNIAVNAGDMIAFQPVGRGLQFAAGSTTCTNNYDEMALTIAGTTIGTLTPGQIISGTTTPTARQHLFTTEVIPGPAFVTANVPGGMLRLDSNGDIPSQISRSADAFWRGKKIIWVGISIPAISGAGHTPPDSIPSYPVIVGQSLQASMDNESVGSSGIVWGGARCLSLMPTQAQLTAAPGCSGYTAQSYQVKVQGKHADLLVIDHGHNDVASPAMTVSGTLADNSTATAYSASGGTLTITGANNFTNGQTILISAASTDPLAPLDGQTLPVLATGLSATQFAISTGAVTGSGQTKATAINQATFYGAYQGLIAVAYNDNLLMRIALVTPPKSPDRGYTPALDMTALRAAITAIAQKWQLPVVDLQANDGFNDTNYCVGGLCPIYTADGIHPQGYARQILARILYQAIKAF